MRTIVIGFWAAAVLCLVCRSLTPAQKESRQDSDSMAMELLVLDLEFRSVLQQIVVVARAYNELKLAEKASGLFLEGREDDLCGDMLNFNPGWALEKVEEKAVRAVQILQRAHVLIGAGGDAPQSLAEAVREGFLLPAMQRTADKSRVLQRDIARIKEECDKAR